MSRKMKEALLYLGLILPAVLGTVGYYYSGMPLSDSFYNALNLYGLNFADGITSNPVLEMARWMAPVATATAVLAVIQKAGRYIKHHFISWLPGSTVVYGNSAAARLMSKSSFLCVNEEKNFLASAKTQILLFDDLTNLRFFHQHCREFRDKQTIYVALDQFPLEIFDEVEAEDKPNKGGISLKSNNVFLFSPNIIKAGSLWRNREDLRDILYDKALKEKIRMVFIGDGPLGRQVLLYGLQMNLYALDQEIVYEIYGEDRTFAARLAQIKTMNRDRICWKPRDELDHMADQPADVIIISEELPVDQVLNIHFLCPDSEMYCYSDRDMKVKKWVNKDIKIHYFGADEIDITLDTVCMKKLYGNAAAQNEQYIREQNSSAQKWEKLNWYYRMSNIYSASYSEVFNEYAQVLYKDLSSSQRKEISMELEHIRWCRFCFMNGWKYGKNKDYKKKTHNDLVPYGRLSGGEQKKNDRN